jgi:hypothetical protein
MSQLSFRARIGLAAVLAAVGTLCLALLLPVPAHAVERVNHPYCPDNNHCWWYIKANQETFQSPPVGVQSSMIIKLPTVHGPEDHSLAAMNISWLIGDTFVNGVEVGWAVAPSVYSNNNPRLPHLFAFPMRGGYQDAQCWPYPERCGWHKAPGATHDLGETLRPGDLKYFMILHKPDGNWWVSYDNQWIGYFDGSFWLWTFTSGNFTSWYGEVETVGQPSGDCTEMGNGAYGTQPGAGLIGALGYWTQDKSGFHETWAHPMESHTTSADFYNMGDHLNASFFTYGGPGC